MSTEQKENKSQVNYFNSRRKSQNSKHSQYHKPKEKKTVIQPTYDEEDYSGLAYHPVKGKKRNSQPKRRSGDTNDFKTKWKTEICHYWEVNGFCKYGDNCAFAHGTNDIRNRKMSSNYKTKPCKQFFENGFCPYGSRCQFSHKNEPSSPVSYLKMISDFLKSEKVSEQMLKRPRLMTFESLAQSNNLLKENRMKLYEDILEAKNEMKLTESDSVSNKMSDASSTQRGRFMSI